MAKELSEMLADLSAEAKKVEDAFAALADHIEAGRQQRVQGRRDAASSAATKVDESVHAAGDAVAGHWDNLQESVKSGIDDVQQGIADRRHDRDVDAAAKDADEARARAIRQVGVASAAIAGAGKAVIEFAQAQQELVALQRQ
ncbi:MAG: hypothetical protein QM692_08930 [Thermomicrobiales bacterium]